MCIVESHNIVLYECSTERAYGKSLYLIMKKYKVIRNLLESFRGSIKASDLVVNYWRNPYKVPKFIIWQYLIIFVQYSRRQ